MLFNLLILLSSFFYFNQPFSFLYNMIILVCFKLINVYKEYFRFHHNHVRVCWHINFDVRHNLSFGGQSSYSFFVCFFVHVII